MYIFGSVSTGVCALLFGFLGFVEDKIVFLLYSYGLRILEGIAEVSEEPIKSPATPNCENESA